MCCVCRVSRSVCPLLRMIADPRRRATLCSFQRKPLHLSKAFHSLPKPPWPVNVLIRDSSYIISYLDGASMVLEGGQRHVAFFPLESSGWHMQMGSTCVRMGRSFCSRMPSFILLFFYTLRMSGTLMHKNNAITRGLIVVAKLLLHVQCKNRNMAYAWDQQKMA